MRSTELKNKLIGFTAKCIEEMHFRGELENENGNLDEQEVEWFMKDVFAEVITKLPKHKDLVWEDRR